MEEKKKRSYYNLEHQVRYQKEHVMRTVINLIDRTDSDIIQKLDSVENKQGYIKQLIRDDIKRGGQ